MTVMKHTGAWALLVLAACSDAPAPVGVPIAAPTMLYRIDDASATDCPAGGSVVSSGLDRNGDNVLDDTEVSKRELVCKAAPGQAAPPTVLRLDREPPGANCAAGGTAVRTGPDRNGDGVLGDDEITHSEYACGQVLLTRIASEPAGERCSAGGVAFLVGRDRDGDGELADDEVEVRSFACGDVIARDVEIRSDADVAALAGIRAITGTVLIDHPFSLSNLSLPALEHAGGFRVFGTSAPVSLPALQEVDGTFELRGSLLDQVLCPRLRRVGSLALDTIALSDVTGFAALTTVDGDVVISNNHLLTTADLPALRAVGGNVQIFNNEKLSSVHWTIAGAVGDVDLSSNASLASIDVTVARAGGAPSQAGAIFVGNDRALTRLALHVDRVGGLDVVDAPKLAEIALDVATFDGDLSVSAFNPTVPFHLGLTSAGADAIEMNGQFIVSSPLQQFDLAAPLAVHGLCVFNNTLLTRFAPGQPITVSNGVRFSLNGELTSIAPIALTATASLQVINNALLNSLNFVTLTDHQIGGMVVSGNPVLDRAPALDDVTEIHGLLQVQNNAVLHAVFGPALRRIEGPVLITNNPQLLDLQYPQLERVASQLEIENNAALRTIVMPALPDVRDEMSVRGNPQLRHIAFDGLTRANLLTVSSNPHLPACEVRAIFAHVTGLASQSGNDTTAICTP